MSFEDLQMHYAHSDGHTSICFTSEGGDFLTCGSDGDVRIWKADDLGDPASECVGEMALAVAFSGEHFYIGSDNHYVQAYTFPDAKRDGILCRFTAPVTHIAANASIVAAGSCDMEIAVVDKADPNNLVKMIGHSGPVTGVALDPLGMYLASSSCDGSVKIWDVKSGKEVKTINDVFPRCNDFFRALVLGRPSWENETGRFLAIPKGKEVALYVRGNWELETCLSDSKLISNISITEFSPCGKFLAAASTSGELIIWDVQNHTTVASYIHPKKIALGCIAWEPTGKTLAVCDRLGQFSLITCSFEPVLPPPDDIENDNEISLEEIKRSAGWGSQNDDDTASSVADEVVSVKSVQPVMSTHLQPAFQPSSTPTHLQQRFMLWNAVGIVRSFDTEDDKSIEVEFHDTTFHHQLHLKNYDDFCMSALSLKILVLATDSGPSKLSGVFLNAWDGTKEWNVTLPGTESITAVAASGNWVAVSTDEQHLRLFNYSGTQREILTIPGQVVCLAGHENALAVVYHSGLGLPESQNLGFVIYEIHDLTVTTKAAPQPLPIGLKTSLKWAGFTDEGRLCTFDSFGVLRCLSLDMMNWLVTSDTRTQPKAPSDHYFVVGVSERYQNIRCVLCKGSYYPMTMPRPILVEIPLKLPLCEPDSEKSTLEETFWRLIHFLPGMEATAETYSEYQPEATEMEKTLKQTVVKLFANACKGDLNLRAVEIASLMSEQPLQKAYTYASKCGKRHLLEKISEITAADWSELKRIGQMQPNGCVQTDFTSGAEISSQRDLFAESQACSNSSVNKFLEAETRKSSFPTTPKLDNPFKIKDGDPKTSNGSDKPRRQLGALESSRKKVVVLGSGPSFK